MFCCLMPAFVLAYRPTASDHHAKEAQKEEEEKEVSGGGLLDVLWGDTLQQTFNLDMLSQRPCSGTMCLLGEEDTPNEAATRLDAGCMCRICW